MCYGKIEVHPEKVSNIKQFINKHSWKGNIYQSKVDNWKTFEKNNPTIALNILCIKEKERPADVLKINSNSEN